MALQLDRRLFTLDEYDRMVETGVFGEGERLELIRGEIIERAPMEVSGMRARNLPFEAEDVSVQPQVLLLYIASASDA